MNRPRAGRRSVLAGALLLVTLLVPACASSTGDPAAGTGAPATAPSGQGQPATPAPGATPSTTPDPDDSDDGPQPLPTSRVTVTSVRIASIGLRTSRLEKLTLLPDTTLAAPKDPDRAGWYVDGPLPGETGPAVIAGHVDSKTGPAVFARLGEVSRGTTITVGLSNGKKTTFRVDKTVHTAKHDFPTEDVYGPTPDAQLRLITCSGPYDRSRGYLDNTVVFATATR